MKLFRRKNKIEPPVVEIKIEQQKILSREELIKYSEQFSPKQIKAFKIIALFLTFLVLFNIYSQVKYAIFGRDQETQKQLDVLDRIEDMKTDKAAEEEIFWKTIYNDSTRNALSDEKIYSELSPNELAKSVLLDSCDCPSGLR